MSGAQARRSRARARRRGRAASWRRTLCLANGRRKPAGGILTSRLTPAVRRGAETLQLLELEAAGLAAAQLIEKDGTDGHAAQHQDFVPQPCQHTANLAVLALVEDDLQPGAFALRFQATYPASADVAVAEPDALEQLFDILALWPASHLNVIRLLDAETRMHEA